MNQKEYELIAGAVHRTNTVNNMEGNAIKRAAKNAALRLLVTDLTATLKHTYASFEEKKFRDLCGI